VEETTTNTLIEGRLKYRPVNSHSVCMTICLVILFFIFGVIQAEAKWPRVIPSKDGIPISFEVYGTGDRLLYSCMVGVVMLVTGVLKCHISQKIIVLLPLILQVTVIQVRHVQICGPLTMKPIADICPFLRPLS
jgi:hypothetical protein